MVSAKKIILSGVFTALLIGGQLVFSAIAGIEIVTVLLLTFAYKYGVVQTMFVANAFTLLRCFIFGFMPNVLVLYLVYYNIFAIIFGIMGNTFKHQYSIKKHVLIIIIAMLVTVLFTLLDNFITPLMYGFNEKAFKAYFMASLYTVVPQVICTFVTTLSIFPVLINVLKKVD